MILQIDAGNSRVHWRIRLPEAGGVNGAGSRGAFAYFTEPDWSPQSVERVELASVASSESHRWLVARIRECFDAPVYEAHTQAFQCGVRNSYHDPRQMGVDRWLAMLAAHCIWGGGVAVVDAGTAITVDYVNADGVHLGGYILPGSRLVRQSLNQETGRVRSGDDASLDTAPGQSTADCVTNGLAWSQASVVRSIFGDSRALSLSAVVLTGGDGATLYALAEQQCVFSPDLVLEGMDLYWGRMPSTAP